MPTRSSGSTSSFPNVSTLRKHAVSTRLNKRSRRAKILTIVGTLALIMTIVGTIGIVAALAYFSRDLPSPTKLTNREVAQSTKIFDRNGELLYDIYDGEHDRTLLSLKDIPKSAIDATIAAEDANFYSHNGFDAKGILYAFYKDIFSRSIAGGGSTITQQLVKQAILQDASQTPTRKVKELVLAIQIERKYSKDDILQIYLNEIPYGGTAYGIESAAHRFFGKSAKDLSLPEAALLAGLPQSPSRNSPFTNPEGAYARQHYVLNRMVETKKITTAQAEEAKKVKLTFASGVAAQNIKAPHFVLYVKSLLEEQYGTKLVERGGLRVTTTLDYAKQKIAEEEVRKQIDALAKSRANATNAGLISVDPKTGQILSYVGSEDFNDTEHSGNVDIIQRDRQPGSSIKPITYLAAFTKGYTLGTYLSDVPTCFGGTPNYCPVNSTNSFWGPLLPREALANSRNIPAVKMIQLIGVDETINLAHNLGVTTLKDRAAYGLSLGLGAAEMKPMDLASVYAAFANNGTHKDVTALLKVEDSTGHVLDQYQDTPGKKVIDPKYVYLLSNVLSDNGVRQRLFGTGNKLEIGRPAAVKTGTTDNNKDAWTAGYTPSVSTVVWVGNFDNTPMNGIQGSTGATPIWHNYMQRVLTGTPVEQFVRPDGLIDVAIDSVSGMLPGPNSKKRTEIFVKGTEPTLQDTFSQVVKVDKDNGLLANPATIATGNAEEKTCVKLKEELPDWQSYTDTWQKNNGPALGLIPCPTETSNLYHTAGDRPVVTITSPLDGDKVSSTTFTIKASVASAATITQVSFYLDGTQIKQLTSIPYDYTINLDKKAVGPHTILVKASDSNGNEGSSTIKITVTVGGTGGPESGVTPTPVLGVSVVPGKKKFFNN